MLMGPLKTCNSLMAAGLAAWLLLLPPFSVSPSGKTVIDSGAPLSQWETFSSLPTDTQCRKHRDTLRAQLAKVAASTTEGVEEGTSSKKADKKAAAFAMLRERAAAARCVSSTDPRLRAPSATATAK
jgi:hypothetical protein